MTIIFFHLTMIVMLMVVVMVTVSLFASCLCLYNVYTFFSL